MDESKEHKSIFAYFSNLTTEKKISWAAIALGIILVLIGLLFL